MAISNRGEMGVGGGSRGGVSSNYGGVRKAAHGKSRSSAGITGTGGASINPVYNESVPPTVIKINSAVKATPPTKAEVKALKVANSLKTPKLSKADTKKFSSQIDKEVAQYKAARANRTRSGNKAK